MLLHDGKGDIKIYLPLKNQRYSREYDFSRVNKFSCFPHHYAINVYNPTVIINNIHVCYICTKFR